MEPFLTSVTAYYFLSIIWQATSTVYIAGLHFAHSGCWCSFLYTRTVLYVAVTVLHDLILLLNKEYSYYIFML